MSGISIEHTLYCFPTVAPHKTTMEPDVAQTGTPSSYIGRQQMSVTPGGTRYWVPQCDDPLKPYKGQKFRKLDDAITFYKTYAYAVGFDVRQSTLIKARDNKTILWKYMVCSREGYKHNARVVQSVATDGHSSCHKTPQKQSSSQNMPKTQNTTYEHARHHVG
ncbi:FAR1-related protein [Striga asiatica]|uniref:FAR1-related protein n=1 Tax=Striga asiatica TaxID=4170 RepID=A0A5A7R2F7_STRAF|nr:FAR1-related protein [Striga asiatica]